MGEKEEEQSGFTIQDKRSSYQSDDEIEKTDAELAKEKAKEKSQESSSQEEGPFEIDFSTFIMSLTSSAFYHLGDVPDPTTGQVEQNLPAVRQTIDMLMMLQSKTRNNLTPQEDKLLTQLIYELQMKYVAKTK
jgi:hypothetical protein